MQTLEHEPLPADEQPRLAKIARMLADDPPVSLLIGDKGETVELPKAVSQLLRQMISQMAQHPTISFHPVGPILSTQEAADILGVSRPYVVKLLEEGEIPFTRVGVHRRIRVDDLLLYREKMREEQKRAIEEIAEISQELGMY